MTDNFLNDFITQHLPSIDAAGVAVDTENSEQKYCGNPKLEGSQFFEDHYCSNNFNDLSKVSYPKYVL